LRVLFRVGVGFAALVALYVVGFWGLAFVPVNTAYSPRAEGIGIYVSSNGLHTSLVLPVRTDEFDWATDLPAAHFPESPAWATHVMFGWGDRGFLLEARKLTDVRVSTALAALTYLSSAAMHVEYLEPSQLWDTARTLYLDGAEYRALVAYVRASFARDEHGLVRPIPDAHYNDRDAFYEGVGRYGAFYTCNTWTNDGLSLIGVRTACHALFAGGVMRHL
jgi:uncharacterized protein (TIGR02117 family)